MDEQLIDFKRNHEALSNNTGVRRKYCLNFSSLPCKRDFSSFHDSSSSTYTINATST